MIVDFGNDKDSISNEILDIELKLKKIELKEAEKTFWSKPKEFLPQIIIPIITLVVGLYSGTQISNDEKENIQKEIDGLKVAKSILLQDVTRADLTIDELTMKGDDLKEDIDERTSDLNQISEQVNEKNIENRNLSEKKIKVQDIIEKYKLDIEELKRELSKLNNKQIRNASESTNKKINKD